MDMHYFYNQEQISLYNLLAYEMYGFIGTEMGREHGKI